MYQQLKVGDNNKVVKVEHDGCRTKCKGEQQGLQLNYFVKNKTKSQSIKEISNSLCTSELWQLKVVNNWALYILAIGGHTKFDFFFMMCKLCYNEILEIFKKWTAQNKTKQNDLELITKMSKLLMVVGFGRFKSSLVTQYIITCWALFQSMIIITKRRSLHMMILKVG